MIARPVIALLCVLLLVSAGINVFLLLQDRHSTGHNPVARQSADGPAQHERRFDPRSDTPRGETRMTTVPGERPISQSGLDSQSCEGQLTAARSELAVARAQLDRHAPPEARYEMGVADPRSAERLRPELQRVFSSDGGTIHWTVDCRSRNCKLQLLVPSGERSDWMERLQKDDGIRRMTTGMSFHSGTPTNDPITGEAFFEENAYVRLADEGEDRLAGLEVAKQLVEQFRASDAIRACTDDYQQKGTLEAQIVVSENGFSYRFGGTLGATPAGRCIADRLRAMGLTMKIPHQASGVAYPVFRSPPE